MKGSDEVGKEGLKELDEEGLKSGEKIVDICELKYALICYLRNIRAQSRRRRLGQRVMSNIGNDTLRTTNMSSRSFTNVHRTAYPSFSYLSPVVRPSMRASRMRELTGDAGDEASWDAAGVNERDQRTTPPVIFPFDYIGISLVEREYLCERLNSGRALSRCAVAVSVEWRRSW